MLHRAWARLSRFGILLARAYLSMSAFVCPFPAIVVGSSAVGVLVGTGVVCRLVHVTEKM